jgi:hypothetical protein
MFRAIPMPSRLFMAITIVTLFALNGFWLGIRHATSNDLPVQAASIFGAMCGSGAKGLIIGLLLWLCAGGAKNFRLKESPQWILNAATVIYLLGSALAIYCIGLAAYTFYYFMNSPSDAAQSAIFFLFEVACFYWFAARAISYALGR